MIVSGETLKKVIATAVPLAGVGRSVNTTNKGKQPDLGFHGTKLRLNPCMAEQWKRNGTEPHITLPCYQKVILLCLL
jgi:hypothetical protein